MSTYNNTSTLGARGKIRLEQLDDSIQELIYSHSKNKSNPHRVTAAQVGLGNVDNTSDLEKPISNAVQAALDKLHKEYELDLRNQQAYLDEVISNLNIYKNIVIDGGDPFSDDGQPDDNDDGVIEITQVDGGSVDSIDEWEFDGSSVFYD
jgi:hypothetical protein